MFLITCSDLDNVDVEAGGQTTVQGSVLGDLLGPLAFAGFDGIDISESQQFQNQGYSKNQIDSVRLSQFRLEVTDPAAGNFDFLSNISFFVEAEGLPSVEIARLNPIPDGQSVLEMEILDVELRDYAVAETMTITTNATGTSPSDDTTIDAQVQLNVDINIDGAIGCTVASVPGRANRGAQSSSP